MTNRYDYALLEFTATLAEAEATHGEKLQTIIDTFSQSRLDLPLKRLSEIAKVHARAAANLRKHMDAKKNEHLNLWKVCNIYSCCAVDVDKAMRETRATLRTKMAVDGTVVEKPKRRNLLNSILGGGGGGGGGEGGKEGEKSSEKKWFPRLGGYERRAETRASRKATTASLEEKKEYATMLSDGSLSTPPTPPVSRPPAATHQKLTASASLALDPQKPPRPPKHLVPDVPPSIPIAAPPPLFLMEEKKQKKTYATPIYGDLQQKFVGINNNNNHNNAHRQLVEEHSLRLQEDVPSVVRIRTDVDVEREMRRNETTTMNVFNTSSNQSFKKSHYVNIRPQIAQKPVILSPATERAVPVKSEPDVAPTFISVDCYASTVPIPSPRTYFHSVGLFRSGNKAERAQNDLPSSQRSSSSAYSSNFSSASSSNITSFAVENQGRSPSPNVENARIVRVASPDEMLHRF